ncbi:chitin synthase chs-2-like [Saccostrea cucullata]|uniref:chitin synthase chs-2-like n=1 Tax=Saccostrea cuccullata TaxID=36930 RepID=UPI002ED318AC
MFGNRMHVLISAVWLLSLYWVGQHIWFPSQERLAKATRLFVNPLYCGILLEQHLVMNRRRKQQKINKKGKNENNKECVYMPEMDSNQVPEMDSNQVVLKEETNTNEKNHPVVYACATMWHETRFEMVQLLKSLFRLDKDQFDREVEYQSAKEENKNDPNKTNLPEDYYEFEAHILFDDAFNENGNVNHYVETFESVIKESARYIMIGTNKLYISTDQ